MKGWSLPLPLLLAAWCAQAAPLAFTRADAQAAYAAAAGLVTNCTPRNAGTIRGRLAAEWIHDRVSRAGVDARLDVFSAPVYDETALFANVVAEFPGTDPSAPWIVLMSHYDTAPNVAPGFEGANDGASTSGLLVALAAALRRADPLRDNVMLVWTDAEECRIAYMPRDGFQGSRHLVASLRARRRAVKAAICLDMLGDRDLTVEIPANATPSLVALALRAARAAGVADKVRRRDAIVVRDDHSAFLDAGLPAIDLIDFTYGSAPGKNDYWHTPQDTLDKISADSLFVAGRLAAEMINLLSSETKRKDAP